MIRGYQHSCSCSCNNQNMVHAIMGSISLRYFRDPPKYDVRRSFSKTISDAYTMISDRLSRNVVNTYSGYVKQLGVARRSSPRL